MVKGLSSVLGSLNYGVWENVEGVQVRRVEDWVFDVRVGERVIEGMILDDAIGLIFDVAKGFVIV